MNSPAFRHLVWKEYRTQRTMWLVLAVAGLAWQAIAWPFSGSPRHTAEYHIVIVAVAIPIMFVLGSSILLFAFEREERTWNLLRTFPVSPGTMFVAKFGVGLLAGAALFILSWTLAWLIPEQNFPNTTWKPIAPGRAAVCGEWALMSLSLFVWGCFYSLISSHAFVALLLTPATVLLLSPLPRPVLAGIVLAMTAVDFWLTGRWLRDKQLPSIAMLAGRSKGRVAPRRFLFVTDSSELWKRSFSRLLWIEFRACRWIAFWLFELGITFSIAVGFSAREFQNPSRDGLFFYCMAVPYLISVWAFHGDQVDRRFRIAAQQGLSVESVWFAKMLVWMSATIATSSLLIACEALVAFFFDRPSVWEMAPGNSPRHELSYRNDAVEATKNILTWIALAYACGQLASLLFRRVITATIVGTLPLMGIVMYAAMSMSLFGASFFWSVSWIVVVLMFATLVRMRDWMFERQGFSQWAKLIAVACVPALLVFVGFILYRYHQFVPVQMSRALRPEMGDSFLDNKYFPAVQPLYAVTTPGKFAGGKNEAAAAPEVEELQKLLANIGPDGDEIVPTNPSAEQPLFSAVAFDRAEGLLKVGELNEAFVQIVRGLRIERRPPQYVDPDETMGEEIHRSRYWELHILANWFAHPGQTSDRLRFALAQIERELLPAQSLEERMIDRSERRQQQLEEKWSRTLAVGRSPGKGPVSVRRPGDDLTWYRRLFPWEKERTLRLIEAMSTTWLSTVAGLDKWAATEQMDLAAWMHEKEVKSRPDRDRVYFNGNVQDLGLPIETLPPWKWVDRDTSPLSMHLAGLGYTSLLNSISSAVSAECERRGILIVGALILYRRDHKTLPDRLDEFAPNYLASVPIDPWTGREFNYRPQGFSGPLEGTFILANQPVVWSPGRYGGRPYEIVSPPRYWPNKGPVVVLANRFAPNDPLTRFKETLTFLVP